MEYIIDDEYDGVRLDRFLRKKMLKYNLGEIYKMLRSGKIKVNGSKKKENYRLALNDKINIYILEDLKESIKEENFLKLSNEEKNLLKNLIVFENEDLFIVNKPFNISVHRGTDSEKNLLDYYRSLYNNSSINFVNRIDKATQGLVIATKNIKTARLLSKIIRENKISKKYYCLVNGAIKESEFIIKSYLKKLDDKVYETTEKKDGYKLSITKFKVLERKNNKSLIEAELLTGRTHQIRVQLSNLGHFIIGDKKYGKISNREKMLYLFSHYLKIDELNIEIDLKIPKFFIDKINYKEER